MPPSMSAARRPLWPRLLLAGSVLVVLLLAAETAARFWIGAHARVEPPRLTEQVHCTHDERLGWRNLPSVSRPDIYGPGLSLTTNARGFRALEEHAAEVPAGRYRIVCLGDSFTMGYGVDDRATYPAALQRLCPELQAVNMGLGGYGLDQDYLWYLSDGTALQADLLLFAVIDADLNRLGLDEFGGFPKPRVDLEGDELVVRNLPVPREFATRPQQPSALAAFLDGLALWQLRKDAATRATFTRPAPWSEERVAQVRRVAERIFAELSRLSAERGQRFVLAYLPTGSLAGREATDTARWVRGFAASSGTPFVDLAAAFAALPQDDIARHFLPDRHLSAEGNEFVARALLAGLPRLVPGFPECDG
jgi:hypothetical protein